MRNQVSVCFGTLYLIATSGFSRVLEYSIRSSTEYSSCRKLNSRSPTTSCEGGSVCLSHNSFELFICLKFAINAAANTQVLAPFVLAAYARAKPCCCCPAWQYRSCHCCPAWQAVVIRVVSSEISGNFPRKSSGNFRKFIPIFPEISGNLLNNFFTL